MLIGKDDGTFVGGPLDVIMILMKKDGGTFHVCFVEEYPLPGPRKEVEETVVVRLKSKMHHTQGATTFLGALEHLEEMRKNISLPNENVWLEPREWDGEPFVMVVPNWRNRPSAADPVLGKEASHVG